MPFRSPVVWFGTSAGNAEISQNSYADVLPLLSVDFWLVQDAHFLVGL
jgi:hypothetical protein